MSGKSNKNVYTTLGASNHCKEERQAYDLYCTHPDAVKELLKLESFSHDIWEPCDGLGHISDVLIANGHNVRRSDLLTRGRDIEQMNFLTQNEQWDGDIITNPPYSCATAMVRKAIETVAEGCKVAMWLRILYLESMERKILFQDTPPVASGFHQDASHAARMDGLGHRRRGTLGSCGRKDIKGRLN